MQLLRDVLRGAGLLALVLGIGAPAQGQDPATAAEARARPKIGLVLSGGGARGIAHIGTLKVLEELRVPVDYIAGTSMGSIVAGSYALGMSPQEMEKRVLAADWDRVLADAPPRADRSFRSKALERAGVYGVEAGVSKEGLLLPQGVIAGQNLEVFLAELTGGSVDIGSFDALPIPFRAVATDIETGEAVVLERGNILAAMRSSMSVPGVFSPVEIDGRLLLDGGLVRNLPVDVVRAMGAEVVIAVNLGTPLLKRDEIESVFSVSQQMLNILTEQNVRRSLAELTEADVLIEPELGGYSASDFVNAGKTIPIGEAAARKVADRLRALGLPEDEYRALRNAQLARISPHRPVDEVRVDTTGLRHVNPRAVTAEVSEGAKPDLDRVHEDVTSLLATDDFQQVRYRFVDEDGKRTLVLEPVEKSWGPNYLRFGLNLATDLEGESEFTLIVDHRMTWLNRWGLEWRNTVAVGETTAVISELYQPIDPARKFFVAPAVGWIQRSDNLYFEDEAIARYRTRESQFRLDLGWNISRAGQLRLGYQVGSVYGDRRIGVLFADYESDIGALVLTAALDRLDDWAFPSSGYLLTGQYKLSREALAADFDYERFEIEAEKAFSFGGRRHRLVAGLHYGDSFGSDLPLHDLLAAGGFANLSGLQPRELLVSDRIAVGRLVYYYRWGDPGAFTDLLYLGGSLEAAEIGDRVNGPDPSGLLPAGSVFVAADTALGPLYLGLGLAESGRYAFYLFLGRPQASSYP
jgi:NTE family protein